MQIVIDMPDNLYEAINIDKYGVHKGKIYDIIRNGTPLPKSHGDLIDKSNLLTTTDYDGENEKTYVLYEEIENAPTIIKANKESER